LLTVPTAVKNFLRWGERETRLGRGTKGPPKHAPGKKRNAQIPPVVGQKSPKKQEKKNPATNPLVTRTLGDKKEQTFLTHPNGGNPHANREKTPPQNGQKKKKQKGTRRTNVSTPSPPGLHSPIARSGERKNGGRKPNKKENGGGGGNNFTVWGNGKKKRGGKEKKTPRATPKKPTKTAEGHCFFWVSKKRRPPNPRWGAPRFRQKPPKRLLENPTGGGKGGQRVVSNPAKPTKGKGGGCGHGKEKKKGKRNKKRFEK